MVLKNREKKNFIMDDKWVLYIFLYTHTHPPRLLPLQRLELWFYELNYFSKEMTSEQLHIIVTSWSNVFESPAVIPYYTTEK